MSKLSKETLLLQIDHFLNANKHLDASYRQAIEKSLPLMEDDAAKRMTGDNNVKDAKRRLGALLEFLRGPADILPLTELKALHTLLKSEYRLALFLRNHRPGIWYEQSMYFVRDYFFTTGNWPHIEKSRAGRKKTEPDEKILKISFTHPLPEQGKKTEEQGKRTGKQRKRIGD